MMARAALALLLAAAPADAQVAPAIVADPPADARRPAAMEAFVLPVEGGQVNAVLYTAAGPGPHPAMLLLHGFPGNEQNLDLAQAARRAGWHVLTLHYRGSWGSPGAFSFAGATSDAHSALRWLRDPATLARHRIDPARIVVAGHSMGGFMAAAAGAADPRAAGLILIDAWDIAGTGRWIADPANRAEWEKELAGNLPPLNASGPALTAEMMRPGPALDLPAKLAAYGGRPVLVLGATRGNGPDDQAGLEVRARAAGADVTAALMPTDHSFSDHRIALADAVVRWLGQIRPQSAPPPQRASRKSHRPFMAH